jgi:hypothetical protein
MMDLYKLHDNAEQLDHFSNKHNISALHAWMYGLETKQWNEKILAKDARIASMYATNFLKRRFELAEPVMAKHPLVAYDYCRVVAKGRVPAFEKEPIFANSQYALAYVMHIAMGEFKLAEPKFAKSAGESFYYSTFIKRRFKAGEAVIATNRELAGKYNRLYGTNL